ncbi:histone-lysine N-methyltransferase SETD1B-like [Sardina pilchardus]|uniref:histone-lysine N-methyltransferase SETD1B-like n=1 Tax=Sardina pilchardus TaxID=27697 RepID=UPI002E155111
MHSSSRPSVPARPRRFETNRQAEPKTHGPGARREDKNMNTSLNTATSSTRRVTRGPPESSRFRSGAQAARNTAVKPTVARQQKNTTQSSAANPKPKSRQAVSNLPPVVTDPNCNEPSLPCLCCDGRSPQDSNSLFNHNHNNNNTITMRQQLQLQQPSIPRKEEEDWQRKPVVENKAETKPDRTAEKAKEAAKGSKGPVSQVDKKKEENLAVEDKERVGEEDSDIEVAVSPGVDPNGNDQVAVGEEDDGDDDDDDTLVPSCCDCPASMLEFSLTSSTSSSSTSISSCSDLELDCPDTYSLSSQDQDVPERYPSARSPVAQSHILPLDPNVPSGHPMSPCSPDEGYPSAPCSPSSDFADCKEETEEFGTKPGLLNFLDSMDELGKMDRFYHVVQVVCWELDDEMGLRDRLDHLYRLEKVNRQVKLFHLAKLQEAGLDLEDEDISDVLDEMGNIDIPWKLYKGDSSCDSQEFSDAGVDVSGPSDLDEPAVPDSLGSSPVEPPPRPPKPPVRHVSAQPETHTYINIEQSSPVVSSSPSPTSSAVSSSSPSSHLIKKPIPDPPPLPPPPSQAISYFTLYSASPCAPSPTPPIPPPRTRHLARREALRCAQLQAEQSPMSLPPPTSKPPPLPPPPALPSPPKTPPPPPSLPPPPSFHALDVEIQKLLALAGLTQAELLKLSPELGVCVDYLGVEKT